MHGQQTWLRATAFTCTILGYPEWSWRSTRCCNAVGATTRSARRRHPLTVKRESGRLQNHWRLGSVILFAHDPRIQPAQAEEAYLGLLPAWYRPRWHRGSSLHWRYMGYIHFCWYRCEQLIFLRCWLICDELKSATAYPNFVVEQCWVSKF